MTSLASASMLYRKLSNPSNSSLPFFFLLISCTLSLFVRMILATSGQDNESEISLTSSNSSICLGYNLHVLHSIALPASLYRSHKLSSFKNAQRRSYCRKHEFLKSTSFCSLFANGFLLIL